MYLIDTNIFLEVLLTQKRSSECKDLLRALSDGVVAGIVTDFSVYSIVLKLQVRGKSPVELASFLSNLSLLKGLQIYALSVQEKISATSLMQSYGLDFDDALQVQAALSNSINEIVSFDGDFDEVKEVKRVTPADVLKELK